MEDSREKFMKERSNSPFAVITGASSGIGLALAHVFAEHGFDLIIAAEEDGIYDAATELSAAGHLVQPEKIDLAQYDGVEALYEKIRAVGRPVDALVLNAGVGVSGPFVDGTALEDELNLLRLNVISPLHLCKRVAKDMLARGEGKILFTSSIASTMPGPYYAAYAASKAFLQSFAEAIRNELKDSGISVTSLMPGATDTNFFARAGMQDTPAGEGEKDDPALVAQQGFDALMAGEDHVVTGGLRNRLQTTAAKLMTDPMKAKVHAKYTKPRSISR